MNKTKLIILVGLLFSIVLCKSEFVVNASNNYKFNTYQLYHGNKPILNGTIELNDKPIIMDKTKINKTKYYQLKNFGISDSWIKAKDLKVFKQRK